MPTEHPLPVLLQVRPPGRLPLASGQPDRSSSLIDLTLSAHDGLLLPGHGLPQFGDPGDQILDPLKVAIVIAQVEGGLFLQSQRGLLLLRLPRPLLVQKSRGLLHSHVEPSVKVLQRRQSCYPALYVGLGDTVYGCRFGHGCRNQPLQGQIELFYSGIVGIPVEQVLRSGTLWGDLFRRRLLGRNVLSPRAVWSSQKQEQCPHYPHKKPRSHTIPSPFPGMTFIIAHKDP